MALALSLSARSTAAEETAPVEDMSRFFSSGMRSKPCSVAKPEMRAHGGHGHMPGTYRRRSRWRSWWRRQPSRTALAQSEASAPVGTGELTMEPRTSVATMTGLAYWRASSMHALGGQRDLFQRALDGHVATGGHDAVERLDDLLEVLQGLRLLDLGDDRDAAAFLVHDLVGAVDVGGRSARRTWR